MSWPISLHDTRDRYYEIGVDCGTLWFDNWDPVTAEVTAAGDIMAGVDHTHLNYPDCLFARKPVAAALRWPVGIGVVMVALSFTPERKSRLRPSDSH